jgi:squalene-hopene/tetraprenyl-beta-curcumene cyclase
VAVIDSALGTLLAHKTEEGGIVGAEGRVHHRTYATTLTLQALALLADPARKADVEALRAFLVKVQLDDDDGITDYDFARYGAWNYFDNNRPATIRADVSATAYAAQALNLGGLDLGSPTVKKALGFLERSQNLPKEGLAAEELALLDGGFAFGPRDSKAGRRVFSSGRIIFRSYGSATADGLRALLWLGVPKDDPRVKAALGWLGKNFTLRVNPGFPAEGDGVLERGIFYYYLDALTDALARAGVDTLSTGADRPPIHWRNDVARRLVSLQRPDGSWAGDVAVMNEDDPAQATSFALLALTRCVGGPP